MEKGKLIIDGIDVGGSSGSASSISYSNTNSGLSSTNVQGAIDELATSSITTYKNPTSIPIKSGMQIILYAASAGTMTMTMGEATQTIALETSSDCKWMLWLQTDERSGSIILTSGTRQYFLAECVVEEAIISWTPDSSYTGTVAYILITIE